MEDVNLKTNVNFLDKKTTDYQVDSENLSMETITENTMNPQSRELGTVISQDDIKTLIFTGDSRKRRKGIIIGKAHSPNSTIVESKKELINDEYGSNDNTDIIKQISDFKIETIDEELNTTIPRSEPEKSSLPKIENIDSVNADNISSVVDHICENPETIDDALNVLGSDPSIIDTVKKKIMEKDGMKQINKSGKREKLMTTKKKKEMLKIDKALNKANLQKRRRNMIKCCMINGSRKVKAVFVDNDFPVGTDYQSTPFHIKDDIHMYYNEQSNQKNKRLERICGFRAGREAYFMRIDNDGDVSSVDVEDIESL